MWRRRAADMRCTWVVIEVLSNGTEKHLQNIAAVGWFGINEIPK